VSARTVAGPLALLVQLGIAAVVLGMPDVGAAGDFLTGGTPTGETVVAACSLLLWAVLALAVVVQAVAVIRQAAHHLRREPVRAGALVLVGLVIFAGGALRHAQSSYSMCCGSAVEAQQAAGEGP
jgi:hypothetical protein